MKTNEKAMMSTQQRRGKDFDIYYLPVLMVQLYGSAIVLKGFVSRDEKRVINYREIKILIKY